MSDFQNKVILVTGATSGLGETAAISLARQGAKVAISGRRQDRGEAVIDRIKAAGGEGIFIQTDVAIPTEVESMVAKTVDHFGRLDGAVNNAGITGALLTPTADISFEDWNATINTNLNGIFSSMKYEIPAMLQNGGGVIVNMSSMYGLKGSDLGHAAYSASKWGVIGLTKSAAIDYGDQGIRVNAICPGHCHSEMVDPYVEAEPEFVAAINSRHSAMNRLGESQEVADVIEWLLSARSSFVHGAAIPIVGGDTTKLY